jgi:hypothetical protein
VPIADLLAEAAKRMQAAAIVTTGSFKKTQQAHVAINDMSNSVPQTTRWFRFEVPLLISTAYLFGSRTTASLHQSDHPPFQS